MTTKFRIWDNTTKEMLYDEFFIIPDGTVFSNYTREEMDCVLMQFTGLLDKNGKEIYEGDIMKFSYQGEEYTDTVVWENCIVDYTGFVYENTFRRIKPKDDEVLGDIYSHPELLTK